MNKKMIIFSINKNQRKIWDEFRIYILDQYYNHFRNYTDRLGLGIIK